MRVINNLCVVTCGLTLRVFEEINFRKIVGRFEEGVGWEGRVEILELIIVVCCVGAGES